MSETNLIVARKEFRRLIENLEEPGLNILIESLRHYSECREDENSISSFNFASDFNISLLEEDKQQEFTGQFEFFVEIMGYTTSFSGSFDGTAILSTEYIPPLIDFDVNVEIDAVLEFVILDIQRESEIKLNVLENKDVVPEKILKNIENIISEMLKNKII